jgi:hypothetical protein
MNKMKDTLPEEMLDKMIGVLEGPFNKVGERVLKSRVVLLPLSLTMTLSFKLWARVLGKTDRRGA